MLLATMKTEPRSPEFSESWSTDYGTLRAGSSERCYPLCLGGMTYSLNNLKLRLSSSICGLASIAISGLCRTDLQIDAAEMIVQLSKQEVAAA